MKRFSSLAVAALLIACAVSLTALGRAQNQPAKLRTPGIHYVRCLDKSGGPGVLAVIPRGIKPGRRLSNMMTFKGSGTIVSCLSNDGTGGKEEVWANVLP